MEAPSISTNRYPFVLLAAGVILLLAGSFIGLFVVPAEQYMGDVQRIMYVHVPTDWT